MATKSNGSIADYQSPGNLGWDQVALAVPIVMAAFASVPLIIKGPSVLNAILLAGLAGALIVSLTMLDDEINRRVDAQYADYLGQFGADVLAQVAIDPERPFLTKLLIRQHLDGHFPGWLERVP